MKRLSIILIICLLCVGGIAQDKSLTLGWNAVTTDIEGNPEDMDKYYLWIWMGEDTTQATFDFYDEVDHTSDSTISVTFTNIIQCMDITYNIEEGLWFKAGVKAIDTSGNASKMSMCGFWQYPLAPDTTEPAMPKSLWWKCK